MSIKRKKLSSGITCWIFDSKSVKVYPCNYRGEYEYTVEDITKKAVFDPESRLNTEYTQTTNFGKTPKKTSYLISDKVDDSKNRTIECLINGYYFKIDNFTLPIPKDKEDISNDGWDLAIELEQRKLVDNNIDERYTYVLKNQIDGRPLDICESSSNYYFTGLALYKHGEVPATMYSLALLDKDGNVKWNARTLDQMIEGGDATNSIQMVTNSVDDVNHSYGEGTITFGKGNTLDENSSYSTAIGIENDLENVKNSAVLGSNNRIWDANKNFIAGSGNTSTNDSLYILGEKNKSTATGVTQAAIIGFENTNNNKETVLIGEELTSSKNRQIILGNKNKSSDANFIISNDGTNEVELTYGNKLDINTANVNLEKNLTVSGKTTLNNSLDVSNETILKNTLDVYGKMTAKDDVEIDQNLTVKQDTTIDGGLTVSGQTALKKGLNVSGAPTSLDSDVNILKTLNVSKTLKVEDKITSKSLEVDGTGEIKIGEWTIIQSNGKLIIKK